MTTKKQIKQKVNEAAERAAHVVIAMKMHLWPKAMDNPEPPVALSTLSLEEMVNAARLMRAHPDSKGEQYLTDAEIAAVYIITRPDVQREPMPPLAATPAVVGGEFISLCVGVGELRQTQESAAPAQEAPQTEGAFQDAPPDVDF